MTEPVVGFVLAAVVMGIIVFSCVQALIGRKSRARRRGRELARIANRLDAEFVAGTPERPGGLKWSFQGQTVFLHLAGDPIDLPVGAWVEVDVRRRSPGALRIYPAGAGSRVAALLGAQDVRVGDEAFDREVVIKSNPSELALRVFSPERRTSLIASLRSLGAPSLALCRQALSIVPARPLTTVDGILALAKAAELFAAALLEPAAPKGLWIVDEAAAAGQCLVCGTPMSSGVVLCSSCRTPHHEECWNWSGACSTFGCGQRVYHPK